MKLNRNDSEWYINMDEFNIPKRKYSGGLKKAKTLYYPKALIQRLSEEAKELGMKDSDLLFTVLDLWLQERDKINKNRDK